MAAEGRSSGEPGYHLYHDRYYAASASILMDNIEADAYAETKDVEQ